MGNDELVAIKRLKDIDDMSLAADFRSVGEAIDNVKRRVIESAEAECETLIEQGCELAGARLVDDGMKFGCEIYYAPKETGETV